LTVDDLSFCLFNKQQQVFGVAPPQTLYHRPGAPSPAEEFSPRPSGTFSRVPPVVASADLEHKRLKSKKRRPSSTDSSRRLLGESEPEVVHSEQGHEISVPVPKHNVYTHYQHSLMSLSSIIDRVCACVSRCGYYTDVHLG
jgi:hypothetical protein